MVALLYDILGSLEVNGKGFSNYGGSLSSASTTWACLIDLDDSTNYPHNEIGWLDISSVSLTVDRSSNAAGSVTVGIITRIDGTDADVTLFFGKSFTNATDRNVDLFRYFGHDGYKALVIDGETPQIATTARLTGITALNTGLTIPSAYGTTTPAVGDLVIRAVNSAGNFSYAVQFGYHGEAIDDLP